MAFLPRVFLCLRWLCRWWLLVGCLGQAHATTLPPITAVVTGDVIAGCSPAASSCFDETHDRVCWLRYGHPCQPVWLWKVCQQQTCDSLRRRDRCDSAWDFLARRPSMLGERDLGRGFPRRTTTSPEDWACLSTHGFYCDELTNERQCRVNFGRACSELRHWVDAAITRCRSQRGSDCDRIDRIARHRPASHWEVLKARESRARDVWLEAEGALEERRADAARMDALLEGLPGLDPALVTRQWSCRSQPSRW